MLMGIDIGTTSVKTIICDYNGKIIYSTSESQNLYSKQSGWAEENPEEWWENTKKTINSCFENTNINPNEVDAVGVTGMLPALVLLDKNNNILRRSIQQNDARTVKEIDYIKDQLNEEKFFEITGGSINQQLIGPKIIWIKENEPNIYNQIDNIFGSYDFINYKLTGNKVVEHNWALESGLLNINNKQWDNKLLELFQIDEKWLPDIKESSKIIGEVTNEAADATGLLSGTPVVAGVADHVSSAFTAGVIEEGDLNIKIGGAGDILISLDKLVTDPRLFIDYHAIPNKYMINGCMAASGSLLKWFIKEFCQLEHLYEFEGNIDKVFSYFNDKAFAVNCGSEGIIILPYFLGEKTPIHNPKARGVIFGLGLHHKKEHLYRAIMESIAYGFKHHVDILKERNLKINNVIVTDGGAKSKVWRSILADVIGVPIKNLKNHPGSSLGAAFIAGMGINKFKDYSEIKKYIKVDEIIKPNSKNNKIYKQYYELYLSIYKDLNNNKRFDQLNQILNYKESN